MIKREENLFLKKDITDFNTLSTVEQKEYYELLWYWIQSHGLTYDLFKFLKQEEEDGVKDVSNFFADYYRYIDDEAKNFEAGYQREKEEYNIHKIPKLNLY
jgi:hypothetical protein